MLEKSANDLTDFLRNPKNTTFRECILKHKFIFDAQLSFAQCGHRLLVYESEYDCDGFDLIFDALNFHKHFQMKSVVYPSKTSSFEIHRNLLRPSLRELDYFPVSPDSFGIGYGGGVLLIQVFCELGDEELRVEYYFSDGLILSAFGVGALQYKQSNINQQVSVEKCFKDFSNPNITAGHVRLTKSCFLKFRSLRNIFAWCGFDVGEVGAARFNMLQAVASRYGRADRARQKSGFENSKRIARLHLSNLAFMEKLQP